MPQQMGVQWGSRTGVGVIFWRIADDDQPWGTAYPGRSIPEQCRPPLLAQLAPAVFQMVERLVPSTQSRGRRTREASHPGGRPQSRRAHVYRHHGGCAGQDARPQVILALSIVASTLFFAGNSCGTCVTERVTRASQSPPGSCHIDASRELLPRPVLPEPCRAPLRRVHECQRRIGQEREIAYAQAHAAAAEAEVRVCEREQK